MSATQRWELLDLGGDRLRYSAQGRGPVLVIPRKDRGPYRPVEVLSASYRVIQVEPLGFGGSDRPDPYPPLSLPSQILAVCDYEDVEDFAVWGYSQGGAMACALALASPRARVVVCGGFNVLHPPSPAWLARMDREQRVPVGSRAFWNAFATLDWHHELRSLRRPVLMYAGTRDRQCPSRHDQLILSGIGVDVVALPGLDHSDCALTNSTSPATQVVMAWLDRAWPPRPCNSTGEQGPRSGPGVG